MVICLERGADLHMAQLMSLPLTVSCFSKIQIDFTLLVPADPGSPGKGPLNGCVCVCSYKRRQCCDDTHSSEFIKIATYTEATNCCTASPGTSTR